MPIKKSKRSIQRRSKKRSNKKSDIYQILKQMHNELAYFRNLLEFR